MIRVIGSHDMSTSSRVSACSWLAFIVWLTVGVLLSVRLDAGL
jgi:hypothetical protein